MKITKIDKLGRIVIPINYRKQLGIKAHDNLAVSREGRSIIISTQKCTCLLCGNDVQQYQKMQICDECIKQIKDL